MKNKRNILTNKDDRNVCAHILYAFVIKGISLVVSLFSMPLYIKYFNNDTVLGLWVTILSVLSWINICDLGLGNGMRNRLTEAVSLKNTELGKTYISSTYVITAAIIIPVIITIICIIKFADINSFFNISRDEISESCLFVSLCILLLGIGINFVLRIVNYTLYAIQKSSINNLLSLFTSLLPLLYVLMFNGSGNSQRNLITLSVVHAISLNLPLVAATILLFSGKQLREYRPSLKYFDFSTAKSMLGFGLQFFMAQIFFMILMSTNEIIITRLFSAEYVVEYSIYYRIFHVIGSLFTLALTPIWSKVTKDFAEKNYKKIRTTNHILYAVSVLAVVGEFIAVVVLQPIVNIWLGDEAIPVNNFTAIVFAIFGSLYIINTVLTTVANGIGCLKTQIYFYGIGAILKIPVIYLVSTVWNNWSVVVLFNSIILLAFCIFQFFWIEIKINNLIKSKNNGGYDNVTF